ncbi:proteasome lid subunit RPN8/RPN11 [Sphingomonas sp. PP-CE-1A-559]|uniref:M67 family metallopeptidase n=1 Tax=unclassified Sphingomonas TaxID=196159 RepID=UPI000E75211A|nr:MULTISPECIES: M67 family metallopeptidase [unclassified Sphingomonas]RKE53087.1 proteasome lid subunit RPN8/RPN11 [Sphingomonas sp. PP-CC-1A-547]TCM09580.1 proteasome lid subunit RPN8/RPN11 [Sphingomonas sp. PP-CC-3G-468]TCP94562.1 proteasome lid subunit RPN8/RPN11 [Sphingomonas sp. PP-CE-1A-559]
MSVTISSELLRRLVAEAAASPDAEVCGLLFGAEGRIEMAEACANVALNPARAFEIDPTALFAAHRHARSGGMAVIGHYHSHPTGSPVPSPRDAAQAMGDGAVWVILGTGGARAWRSVEVGAFVEEVIEQIDDIATPA